MKLSLATLFVVTTASSLHAATVGWWRFEGSGFLSDSSGNGLTLAVGPAGGGPAVTSPTQVALPGSGNGSHFPTTVGGNSNGSAASFTGSASAPQYLSTVDSPLLTSNTFTIEAFVNTTSTGLTQAIAGQLAGSAAGTRAYLLAMNGSNMLQFNYGSTVVASTLNLSLNTDYFVALAVNMGDTTPTGITFFLKNLATGAESMQSFTHSGTTIADSSAGFSIGSTSTPSSQFSGLIDEVRLSNTKLTPDQLLVPLSIPEPASAIALVMGGGLLALRRRRAI